MVLLRFAFLLVVLVVASVFGRGPTAILQGVHEATALQTAPADDDDSADVNDFGMPVANDDANDDGDGDGDDDGDAAPIDGVPESQRRPQTRPLLSYVSLPGIGPSGDHRPTSDRPPQT